MALVGDGFVYLHAPKTAGHMLRHAIAQAGLPTREVGDVHAHFPQLLEIEPGLLAGRKVIAFVRHPLTWYGSFWSFRVKHGWQPSKHPLDFRCMSNDFCTFVNRVLDWCPVGWVTWQHDLYVGGVPHDAELLVGRYESLLDDYVKVMAACGHAVPQPRNVRVNHSDVDGRRSGDFALYDADTRERVLAAERQLIERYYPSQ